jgi:serine incorporator 1/3
VLVAGGSISCLVAGTVIMYVYYTKPSGCGLNIFFITFNLILGIVMMVGSVLPRVQEANPRSGLMQSSVLSAYLTYITLSALTSEPITADFNCASVSATNSFSTALFYIGFVLTFFALALAAFSTGSLTDPGLNQDGVVDDEVRAPLPRCAPHASADRAARALF